MSQPSRHQLHVQVDPEKDMIVCTCGGIGLIFNVGFLPKHNIAAIGAKPEIVAAPVLICSECGKRLKEPFLRAGDVKEGS
jgi:hypothetical protein